MFARLTSKFPGPLSMALLALTLVLGSTGCRRACPVGPDQILQPGTYYTQYPMYVERSIVRAINPRRGGSATLIPINSAVELVGCKRGRLDMRLDTGEQIVFENAQKHTMETWDQCFAKAFGRQPVDLDGMPQDMLDVLATGTAAVGMERDFVRLVEGPPPAMFANDESQSVWTYKMHGFNRTMTIHFDENGIVTSVSG